MPLHNPSVCDCSRDLNTAAEPATRREFLQRNALGIGGIALSWMLQQERLLAAPPSKPVDIKFSDLKPRSPQFRPQATAMISLFMHGGPSHMD
jgi:hypothetical protein